MTPTTLEEIGENESTFDAAAFAKQALSSRRALAAAIDHTLLKPEATREQVVRLCEEARIPLRLRHGEPRMGHAAYAALAGTGVPVGVVVGFPLGASLSTTKRDEAEVLVTPGRERAGHGDEHRRC